MPIPSPPPAFQREPRLLLSDSEKLDELLKRMDAQDARMKQTFKEINKSLDELVSFKRWLNYISIAVPVVFVIVSIYHRWLK